MKTMIQLICSFALIATASCQDMSTVKVTVTEENGTPIEGANVEIRYLGHGTRKEESKYEKTDASGKVNSVGSADLRICIYIRKDGYYQTSVEGLSRKEDHDLTCLLRKVINPIPLYAKKAILRFPANRQWIGYDFEVGDWLPPHGNGKVSDVSLKCDTEQTGWAQGKGSLEIKFDEDEGLIVVGNGYLITSDLKMPHVAPLDGYRTGFKRSEKSYHNENFRDGIGYFMRTRIRKENDRIVSANYSKLATDIHFDPRQSGWHASDKNKPKSFASVSMTYYFNPTPNDRNLEFDTNRNLFTDLDPTEQVREP